MVGLGDVALWNTAHLDEICRSLQRQVQLLVQAGDDFGKVMPIPDWTGPASDDAASGHRALMRGLDTLAAGASIVTKAVGQAADAITGVQRAITNAQELARRYGYRITESGGLVDTLAGKELPRDLHPEDRARALRLLTDDIAQALRTEEDIDDDLASVLQRAAAGQFGTGDETTIAAAAADGLKDPGLTLPEPPPNATPSQTAAWWNSLSPAGQAILLRDRPATLGVMNGLPAEVRNKANRLVFDQQRADLHHQREELQRRLDGMKESDPAQEDEPLGVAAGFGAPL